MTYICPKCGRKFKRSHAWRKHIKECIPRLTPKELADLYKDLKLTKITDFYPDYEKPIAPERAIR